MSEPSQVTWNTTLDTTDPRLAALPPRMSLRRQQQQPQSQSQSQPQSESQARPNPPPKKSSKKRVSRGPKGHRSKSSSPEKLKPVCREPLERLHPLRGYIDTSGYDQNVANYQARPKYLAAAPEFVPDGRYRESRAQTDELRKRVDVSESQYGGEVSRETLAHGQANFGNDDLAPRGRPQVSFALSTQTSPVRASVEPTQTPEGLSPASEEESDKSESGDSLPFYASLFRPRLAPDGGLGYYTSPVPSCSSIGQVVAVKEALTRFHMGIALMDEVAGENQALWTDGLRRIVDDNMPGLRRLGVVSALSPP